VLALQWASVAVDQEQAASSQSLAVLNAAPFAHHIQRFNALAEEPVTNHIPDAAAWAWMVRTIPFFECPDPEVEAIYYFRWWSFRKHIRQTPQGFVITEFLTPVSHAGEFNTISCAAGFHLAEGRWLHDARYVEEYIQFWLRGNQGGVQPHFHKFSSWFAAAVYDRFLVNADREFITGLLDDLVADHQTWEQERQLPSGLFWQYDVRDGMEESISGSRTLKNVRPTINSYMVANARAIAAIARLAGRSELVGDFDARAGRLQALVQEQLWDRTAGFFKVRLENGTLSDVREAIGYIPWMFDLPEPADDYQVAWSHLVDPRGFRAPYGITTAELRHPQFRSHGVGTCEWDGAVWPFATSQTLYALANALRTGSAAPPSSKLPLSVQDYFDAFLTYVRSQHADGNPYIGEYLDEVTGDWINGRDGRSRYYNHSTFADLVITGVVGLRPRADNRVEVYPLLPAGTWDWFCLDGVKYHDHMLTVLWDKDGSRYGRGPGLRVLADGREIAHAARLERVVGGLP
jgi:hypothetical protein